jgi:transcriptional regulator with XRE-family HTH domain
MVSDRRAFGERLKRQRERRGITLEQISATSKVPMSLFAGLEAGDCARWPAAVYARAYVRAYAEAVGLNGDDVVEEFSTAFALKGEGSEPQNAPSAPAGRLRLSLVEESPIAAADLPRRAAMAAADVLIGFVIAMVVHLGAGANVWITVAAVLTYFAAGRVVTDEPLLYWAYRRLRVRTAPPVAEIERGEADEVAPVGNAASTTA